MGVTRIRFLLEMWRRSSVNLPVTPPAEDKAKSGDRWPIPPAKSDPSRRPPRWPG
jgi:hypothetical protein